MIHDLLIDYLMPVLALVSAGVALLVGKFVLVHIRNATALGIIARAEYELGAAAKRVSQTYVDALKAGRSAASPGGTVLTEEEKRAARDMALAEFKANIGVQGLKALARIIGADSIETWIVTHLESRVNDLKTTAAAIEAAGPTGPSTVTGIRLPLTSPASLR